MTIPWEKTNATTEHPSALLRKIETHGSYAVLAKLGGVKVLLAVVFLLVCTEYCHAQNLYIVEREGLYGFSDRSGEEIIPAHYSAAKPFSEGLAPVYQGGKWGFINTNGKVEIDFQFQDAEGFSDGLAPVRKEQWGYINKNGQEAIPFRFVGARPFSEGMAPVEDHNSWFFIDGKGTPVPGLTGFDNAKCFADGLAPVQVGDNGDLSPQKDPRDSLRSFTELPAFPIISPSFSKKKMESTGSSTQPEDTSSTPPSMMRNRLLKDLLRFA